MESFVYDHKLNGERFDLFCFVFVCDCTSLAITELSYHLLSNFFLDQKKRRIKLNFILGLLGNSRKEERGLGSNGVRRVLDPSATYSFFPGW